MPNITTNHAITYTKEREIAELGSIKVSGKLPTYPFPKLTF